MTQLNTVLIGFGKVASGYADDPKLNKYFQYISHAQVLSEHPLFNWRWVVDSDIKSKTSDLNKWDMHEYFTNIDDIENKGEIDVAVIATPPENRIEFIKKLPNLKAVLVEKPIDIDLKKSRKFLEECDKRNIKVQVNLWRRADTLFRSLAIDGMERHIGKPQVVFGVYGNGLLNNGIHMVDFVSMLFGEIENIQKLNETRNKNEYPIKSDYDAGIILVTKKNIHVSLLPVNYEYYREFSLDIWGENGRLEIILEGLLTRVSPKKDSRSMLNENEIAHDESYVLKSTVGNALWNVYDNLARSVVDNEELYSPGMSAYESEKIIDYINKA